jgi:hypothetical protein
LRAEAERIIAEAVETDRREDELYVEKRGDALPDELADPRTRKARSEHNPRSIPTAD